MLPWQKNKVDTSPKTRSLHRRDLRRFLACVWAETSPQRVITPLLISPFSCNVWLISAGADSECHRQSRTSSRGRSPQKSNPNPIWPLIDYRAHPLIRWAASLITDTREPFPSAAMFRYNADLWYRWCPHDLHDPGLKENMANLW